MVRYLATSLSGVKATGPQCEADRRTSELMVARQSSWWLIQFNKFYLYIMEKIVVFFAFSGKKNCQDAAWTDLQINFSFHKIALIKEQMSFKILPPSKGHYR
jgi:hypothetical protein